ncbi:MAG: BrnT family toxin [Rhodospirillales bacterium]
MFEWDENKAHHKARKHGVGFVAALAVFEDPRRIERVDDRRDYGEDRIQVVGTSAGRVLFVVSTRRGDVIRLICTDAH